MDINTLLTDLASAIATDAATLAWANATYDQDHKVYVNVDIQNPPGRTDCPAVEIHPAAKRVGQTITKKEHAFEVTCGIYDEAVKVHAETNIVEYEGVQRLEAFRKLVEAAIVGVSVGNAVFEEVSVEYDTISLFPFMLVGMGIGITKQLTVGENRYE